MSNNSLRLLFIFGSLIVSGVLIFQSYWLIETWSIRNDEFDTTVVKSLRQVAEKIAIINETELPKTNLIQKRGSNYAVNINSAIDANILEDFLVRSFDEASLNTIFEYAVYDCANDQLAYHNYCNLSMGQDTYNRSENLPKFNDLIYYFVVKFPKRDSYLVNDLRSNILFSLLTVLAVFLLMYALYVIMQQQRVTDLQKDFINNMTHEFKTPISSIKIASDVIINNESVKDNKRINQYARIIKDQNERLNNQVEKVLNIARLEKDQFKLNLEEIELIPFIKRAIEMESLKYEEHGGQISFMSTVTDAIVMADKLHFTNVLSNILDNAFKYCDGTPEVVIQLSTYKNYYRIKVSDSGIGIDKDQIKKIFNKFYRVSTGNVHNVKGFGLGLYYVKNICETHGWKLNLNSTPGKGTDFIIDIPK